MRLPKGEFLAAESEMLETALAFEKMAKKYVRDVLHMNLDVLKEYTVQTLTYSRERRDHAYGYMAYVEVKSSYGHVVLVISRKMGDDDVRVEVLEQMSYTTINLRTGETTHTD